MRRLFGCPDIVSLTEKFLMTRNFYRIFTENNPVMGDSKTFGIPNWQSLFLWKTLTASFIVKCVNFWRERSKLRRRKIFFERPHDMTSQRPKKNTDILHTFIGQRHNFLRRIYVRDMQSPMFVHNWWSLPRNSRPQINTCVSTPCPNDGQSQL